MTIEQDEYDPTRNWILVNKENSEGKRGKKKKNLERKDHIVLISMIIA